MTEVPNIDTRTGAEVDIVELLELRVAERPDHTFIHTPSASLTYADLLHHSSRLAGSFSQLGVTKKSCVAVLMENSVEQVIVWFALARLGALHAPLNTALTGEPLRHVLAVSQCDLVVVDEALLGNLENIQDDRDRTDALVVNRVQDDHRLAWTSVDRIPSGSAGRRNDDPRQDARRQSPNAGTRSTLTDLITNGEPIERATSHPLGPATLLFTSGTTGLSKACVLSRRYLAAQGAAHARNFRLRHDDVLYCPFPLFHIDAATLTVVAALSVGATAALSPRFSASRFWDEVRACGATVFNFMGATLTILWKQPPSALDREHSVRLAWGVPMPEWQHQWTERFGFPLYQVYGSTDAGVPVYDPLDGTQRAGACGRVTELFDLRIAGDAPVGQILVRGRRPGLTMSGYYNMPDETTATIDADGWVHTGDLGSLDSQGFLTFHGRSSDSIRRRGENISAFEVEELAISHPDVLEAAAVGVPSELTEEDLKIYVVAQPGATLEAATLHTYLTQRAPRHMVPRYYELVPSLPKTPTQKVEKFQLKQRGLTETTWDAEN